jgi:hypothetical protein
MSAYAFGSFLLIIIIFAGFEVLCLLSYFTSLQDQAYIRCSLLVSSLSSWKCALFEQLSPLANEV